MCEATVYLLVGLIIAITAVWLVKQNGQGIEDNLDIFMFGLVFCFSLFCWPLMFVIGGIWLVGKGLSKFLQ